MEISGDIEAKDSRVAMGTLSRQVYRGLWPRLIGMLAVLMFALLGGPWALGLFLPPSVAEGLGLPLVVVLTAAWVFGVTRLSRALALKSWQHRGVVYPMRTTYGVDERGFHVATPMWRATYAWHAVSEIAASSEGWVLIVPALGYEAPRRLFVDPDEERAFVRAVLERMNDAARDRSKKARDFIGTWG